MTLTIAVVGTGDMGSAVGAAFVRRGARVLTDLSGRGLESRQLAASADIEDAGSLDALVTEAEILLSILPPADALDFARRLAAAIAATNARVAFADCNAVAPQTVETIAELLDDGSKPCAAFVRSPALTGWGSDEDQRCTRQAGFDRHLIKPVNLDTLVPLIDELTSKPH